MQGINLARRPFVNRRPVLRLAILLWIAGTALAIHNIRQFTGHWQGTAANRDDFVQVAGKVREERQEFDKLRQDLAKVSVRRENQHTNFLNQLIAFRTFPWSILFDDLEQVVPLDVKLLSVKPDVKLKAAPEKPRRQRRRRVRPTTTRANNTEAEVNETATDATLTSSDESEEPSLRRDEVVLQLTGVAKDEDAVVEFIEVLYASPSFRSPFLPGELIEEGGLVRFSLSTIYLTGRQEASESSSSDPSASEPSGDDLDEVEIIAASPSEEAESPAFGAAEAAEGEAIPETLADTSSRLVGTETDDSPVPGASTRESIRRESVASRQTTVREPTSREPRSGQRAVPRSRIRPRPLTRSGTAIPDTTVLPGAGASGSSSSQTGGSIPGAVVPGSAGDTTLPGEPGFETPSTSGTPRLRRGNS